MSFLSQHSVTNHHAGVLDRLAEAIHVWRERQQTRHELSNLSELELHDFGLSIGEAAYEADKPFWQA